MLTGSRAAGVTRARLSLVNINQTVKSGDRRQMEASAQPPVGGEGGDRKGSRNRTGGRYANAVFELAQEQKAGGRGQRRFRHPAQAPSTPAPISPGWCDRRCSAHEDQATAPEGDPGKDGRRRAHHQIRAAAGRQAPPVRAGPDIIAAYERLVARLARRRPKPKSPPPARSPTRETAELKSVLKAKLGRNRACTPSVDPTLLGGLVVKVGSRMIDSSFAPSSTACVRP